LFLYECLGMQAQYLTNQLYDAQAWWARDVILGKIKLPNNAAMLIDIGLWKADAECQMTNMGKVNFQARHLEDLWKLTNCPRFDVNAVEELFKEWELIRQSNLMSSRSKVFKSAIDGTIGKNSNVAWVDLTLKVDAISP
jgi:trimethylamine monooxygenase